MPTSFVRLLSRLPLICFLAVLFAGTGVAQTDARLVTAVREAREGQSDSARKAVARLLAATPASDTLYPQILYTMGIIENDAVEMRRRLQQVAVEFPTSSWADDALLRLAQLDYALRALDGAARHLERLAIGFPHTPLLPHAAYWAGRTYFDLNRPVEACRWLTDGIARVGSDLETKTQLEYLHQRCQNPSPPARTVTDSAAAPKPPAPPPPSLGPRFRVQIAAVASANAADAAARKARELGYPALTVQDRGLYKVRVGEFDTRDQAYLAIATLKQAFGGNPFVVAE